MSDSQLQIQLFSGLLDLEKKLIATCAFQIQRGVQKGFNIRLRVQDTDYCNRIYWRCTDYWPVKNFTLHKPNGIELLLDRIWNVIPAKYKLEHYAQD